MKIRALLSSKSHVLPLVALAVVGCALSPLATGASARKTGLEGVGIIDHQNEESLHVLFFGDSGTGKEDQFNVGRVMNQICAHRGCDLALQLGDNIYEGGIEDVNDKKFHTHFELPYEGFGRFDFWTVAGNHDWRGNVAAEIEYTSHGPRWRMPNYNYAIPKLPSWIKIYGFDTEKITLRQAEEARPHLCDEDATWKVGFGHHPIHSFGVHGDDAATSEVLLPLFEECGVQLYLSGHDHDLEHITGRIFEQFVSGAASKLRDIKQHPYKEGDDRRQNFARSSLGFGIAHFTPETLEIEFYDGEGRTIYEWSTTPAEYGLEREQAPAGR